jgi:glutamate dehydrogenase (NADP+)
VWQIAEAGSQSLRAGAYANALRRIEDAALSHGSREYFQGNGG